MTKFGWFVSYSFLVLIVLSWGVLAVAIFITAALVFLFIVVVVESFFYVVFADRILLAVVGLVIGVGAVVALVVADIFVVDKLSNMKG